MEKQNDKFVAEVPITELENDYESVWQNFSVIDLKIVKLKDLSCSKIKLKSLHKENNPIQSMSCVTLTSEILFGQIDPVKKVFH